MRSINLLPPEIHRQEAARRRRLLYVVLAAAFVAILVLATIWRQGQVSDKEDELTAQENANLAIQSQIAQLQSAEELKDRFDAAAANLAIALGGDVSWGRLLNDFGRLIPDRVWITSFSGSTTQAGEATLGTLTISGTAFDDSDVGAWLRTLDSDVFPAVDGTWVSTVAATTIADVPAVTFQSSTSLTLAAGSDRLRDRIPGGP